MVELRILGSPELTGVGSESAQSVLRRPKRLAFLAYLAVECSGTFERRDKLIGRFWPESEEARARSSLSEALSTLRRILGPDVIVTRGKEEVGVSREHLWCDAVALAEANRTSDLAEVVRLYRSPLLDGFFLDGHGGFDHWLEHTRGRLERIALDAIGQLSDSAAHSDLDEALSWAERSVDLCPLDGPSVRRLITLHARAGHRARALDAFARYERRLDEEHGIDPAQGLIDLVSLIERDAFDPEASKPANDVADTRLPDTELDAPEPGVEEPVSEQLAAQTEPEVPAHRESTAVARDRVVARRGRRRTIRPVLTVVFPALVVLAGWWALDSRVPRGVSRVEVTPPPESALPPSVSGVGFDLSPDGKRIVYVGQGPDARQIWERSLDDLAPAPIAGTEGAWSPAYAPDAGSVVFWTENNLKTVSLATGVITTLVEGLEKDPSPQWADDGHVYYASGTDIYRVPEGGGLPEQITSPFAGEQGTAEARLPDVLPDERGVLVTLRMNFWFATVGVAEPRSGTIRELFVGETARYVESGHIIYSTAEGALMSVPFDLGRLEVTGAHREIAQGVATSRGTASGQFAVSERGDLVYRTRQTPATYQVVSVDRRGRATELAPEWTFNASRRFTHVALSPLGNRVALSMLSDGGVDVWTKALDGGAPQRLTFDGRGNNRPAWSPDGDYLAFVRDASQGEWQLVERRVDGVGEARPLAVGAVGVVHYAEAGESVIYSVGEPASDIHRRSVEPGAVDAPPTVLIASANDERSPALSPDGRWLAYVSDETGQAEVFVRSFPDVTSFKSQVSRSGGTEPVWSRSGEELFYKNGRDELVAVAVSGSTFSPEGQESLFSVASFLAGRSHPMYDASPDGGFIMIRMADEIRPSALILVQNFPEELQR